VKHCFFFACVSLIGLAAPAHATVTCKTIDAAISANEEFVESILEAKPKARLTTREEMANFRDQLAKVLPPDTLKASSTALAALDAALVRNDETQAMLAALQNYAVLVDAFEARLPTSVNVAMLDHAGFSLQALSTSGTPHWARIKTVRQALASDIKAIDSQIQAGPLADLLHDTLVSIDTAILKADPTWLGTSAQILLDSVDLVEAVVRNKAKGACD
jgi:hypothetical protein